MNTDDVVKKAEETLKAAQKLQREVERENNRAWREYRKTYSYVVRFVRSFASDPIALRITQTIVKDNAFCEMEASHGKYRGDMVYNSVGYIRDDEGVLSHVGGGYLILTSGAPITADEWKALKTGDMETLAKFLNPRCS